MKVEGETVVETSSNCVQTQGGMMTSARESITAFEQKPDRLFGF